MGEVHAAQMTAAGIPVFKDAIEEAEFWETHSSLDWPEYWEECEVWLGNRKCLTGPTYRPDLGNNPLPFPLHEVSASATRKHHSD